MENGPNYALPSTPHSSLAPIIPLPVRKRPRKRPYQVRGVAFQQMPYHRWRESFEPLQLRGILKTKTISSALSRTERAVMIGLLDHGMAVIQGRLERRASISQIARWTEMGVANCRRLVTRMGQCFLLVNLGTAGSFDLAINSEVAAWRLDYLRVLRKSRRMAIAEWESSR